jgi:hypothetical protein
MNLFEKKLLRQAKRVENILQTIKEVIIAMTPEQREKLYKRLREKNKGNLVWSISNYL